MAGRPTNLVSFYRQSLSPTVRDLLCVIAAADLARSVPQNNIDWDEALTALSRNGLVGLAHRHLQALPDDGYPPREVRQRVRSLYAVTAVGMTSLNRAIRLVLEQLNARSVDYLVLKGPALAHTVYPEPLMRTFSDLDLMVREGEWQQIHTALLDLGFEPEQGWQGHPPRLSTGLTTHEVKYDHSNGLRVEVHFDDLLNAGLTSRDLAGYWSRAQSISIAGTSARALSLSDQILHLSAHVHYHGYTRLNWLSDLAMIVRDQRMQVDWAQLIDSARCEEAQVSVYYSLYFLEQMLGVAAPAEVMHALRPDRLRRILHECYMPERQIFSLDPMPRPDFSFYFLPLLKRLLPDLLVMGRRREKLHLLLRLLHPPADWLRYYYGLPSEALLAPHYFLHPFKLAAHYFGEIAGAIKNIVRGEPIYGN